MDKRILVGIFVLVAALLFIFGIEWEKENKEIRDESDGVFPIMGQVFLGPQCPVMREGDECADAPYETTIDVSLVVRDSSIFYRSFSTDSEGRFVATVTKAGRYVLKPQGGEVFPTCQSTFVEIPQQHTEEIVLTCDTGIR